MTDKMVVEVVFASRDRQSLQEVRLAVGATVADAIAASTLQTDFPDYVLDDLPVGIWGRVASRDSVLSGGDRVEIYRELEIDPMAARRIRAMAPDPGPSESR